MADEDEAISPEEQLQIAQHFLLNAPPGQFGAVLEDVKVLVPGDLVGGEALDGISREFNTRNLRVLHDGENPPIILSKVAEVDGSTTKYLEPKSKQVFEVDHLKMAVVGSPAPAPAGPCSEAAEAVRVALQEALEAYVEERFVDGTACCAVYGTGAEELTAVVSGEKLSLRNFWSGQFTSAWTVGLADPAGPAVAGEIKARAHYFEEGNVQLQTKKALGQVTLAAGGAAAAAKAVVDHVFASERAVQEGLEEMYTNMSDETFKAMRRVMPVHRNKMNWNIHEVKLNAQFTAAPGDKSALKPL